jgi:hypothetical protein
MNAHESITEQVKWNAPSFGCKGGYIATFNLHAKKHVHLVFHNPHIPKVKSEILEGNYPDRRMVYFSSMDFLFAQAQYPTSGTVLEPNEY